MASCCGWTSWAGRTELVLGGLTISNGLGHAPAFDADRGTISEGRVLVTVAEEVGAPDGMTVDAAGDLWVAVYGGGRVRSTSCAFAGPGLNRLYVTTATEDWSDEQRHAEPAAGLVYRFDTDATGRPAAPFRPAPDWWQQVTR